MLESFRSLRKFFWLKDPGFRCAHPGYELTGAQSAPYENFTLVCHSEERSDEESAFDFSVLVERIGKSAKQMLHFVQHDTTANSERLEDSFCLAAFALLRRSFILSAAEGLRTDFCARQSVLGCGSAALGLRGENRSALGSRAN
jgi:hypothetical protein